MLSAGVLLANEAKAAISLPFSDGVSQLLDKKMSRFFCNQLLT
jgi:hypothetical protein